MTLSLASTLVCAILLLAGATSDLVETAFMIQGLLAARQYFDCDNAVEREIRDTVTRLWPRGRVELVSANPRQRSALLELVAGLRVSHQSYRVENLRGFVGYGENARGLSAGIFTDSDLSLHRARLHG